MLNVLTIANMPRSFAHGNPRWAFVSSGAVIAAFTFLFGVALYPNIVVSTRGAAHNLTVWKAASPPGTRVDLLIAAGIGMPFVLGYTIVTYRVFRKSTRSNPPEPNPHETSHVPG